MVEAAETRQEKEQDAWINKLNKVETILNNPQNAEQLKNNFGAELEKELTWKDWVDKIKKLRTSLTPLLEEINNTERRTAMEEEDQDWLQVLDNFLNDCLLNNEQVQAANQTITQMLKKLDNGMWRDVNIDEKNIDLKSARIDWNNVNLTYTIMGKQKIEIEVGPKKGADSSINPVEWTSSITIPDKDWKDQYFKVVNDADKWWLKLEKDADWLLNKLAWYNVTWDAKELAKVTKEWTWYRVEMNNNIDDSLISFVLDENWWIGSDNTREQWDYKITINQKDNTFNIIDLKADEKEAKIETLKKQEENEIIKNLDFDYIADQKINALKVEQDKEAQRPNWEWFSNAKDIQIKIKVLQENKENYKNILTKTTEIDDKITQIDLDIKAKVEKQDFDWAISLNLEKQKLEWQKFKIQELEWKMKKQASEDKREDVTKTWEEINNLINPSQAVDGAAGKEIVVTAPEIAATGLTKESVISKVTEDLKLWYEKTDSKNELGDIIGLLKIEDWNSPEIKGKKERLSDLLANWDMLGFQKAVWIKEDETWNDWTSRVDGKLGKYTLQKTQDFLNAGAGTRQEIVWASKSTTVNLNWDIVTNWKNTENEGVTQLDQKIIDDLAQETKNLNPSEWQWPADVLPSEKRDNLNEKQKQMVIEEYNIIKNIKEESESKVLNYQNIENDIQKIIAGIDSQNSWLWLTFDRASLMNDRYIKKNDSKIDAMILFYSLEWLWTAEEIIDKVMEKNRINDLWNDYLKSIYEEFNKISPEKNLIDYIKSDYLNYRSSNADRSKWQTYINKFQIANK